MSGNITSVASSGRGPVVIPSLRRRRASFLSLRRRTAAGSGASGRCIGAAHPASPSPHRLISNVVEKQMIFKYSSNARNMHDM